MRSIISNTLAVSVDPYETVEEISRFSESLEFPWEMTLYSSEMLENFNILSQSSKVIVGPDGVIKFKSGYGSLSDTTWEDIARRYLVY
jgi:hypothetical protein|tara:strand:- start:441 stop:704 length:264 start_codon:yes stop_codon:yes gene_type:complete